MSGTQTFARDPPNFRQSHWIVPLGVLVVLVAMTLVPGMLVEFEADDRPSTPGPLIHLPLAE